MGESVKKPLQYYRNNLDSTLSLVETMEEFGCRKLVFSSSATVYGPNNPHPYKEEMPAIQSTSPYGWTKVMIERILTDYCTAQPDALAEQLARINEQLVIKNRRAKRIWTVIAVIVAHPLCTPLARTPLSPRDCRATS